MVYETAKDEMPLVIAFPAAYLAYALQSRASYVAGLRAVWSRLAESFAAAFAYSAVKSPTREEYLALLQKLSRGVEEIRGVYRNVPADGSRTGWYPFEPVKQLYEAIRATDHTETLSDKQRSLLAAHVSDRVQRVREAFLAELDLEAPSTHHAAYAPEIRGQ